MSPAAVAAPGNAAPIGAETPVRDRLVATLFLAAVVHGILILGVTFSMTRPDSPGAPGLDVQLLAEEDAKDEPREADAAYLAQASRVGAGTTRERVAARTPFGRPPEPDPADASAPPAATDQAGEAAAAAAGSESLLASSARRPTVRYSGPLLPAGDASDDLPLLTGAAAGARPRLPATLDSGGEDAVDQVQLTGPAAEAGRWVSPDTRRSLLAPYLDGWRRKVERLGTLNYPTAAADRGRTRWPVLEVELSADGRLRSARIRSSSGDPRLDDAALQILKLASPFDPFPGDMAKVFPELGFAYEWRFEAGGPLSAPASP